MAGYIIIEDERFARDELVRMMHKLRPDYALAGWAQSVDQAVELVARGGYDFIVTDIRLADGLCFDVFERRPTPSPVIFTTAYDEYALKAFQLNSVDYLLKPVDETELARALDKLERNALARANSAQYAGVVSAYMKHATKSRFLIRMGDTYRYVPTRDVALFGSEDKTTTLSTLDGKTYVVDYSLDQIEPMLPSERFFRLSRACIASIESVGRVTRYFGGRLSVELRSAAMGRVVVSRGRAASFLKWLGGDE